jgi:hypothetical protein
VHGRTWWLPMDEIGGAVEGVDDPGWFVS